MADVTTVTAIDTFMDADTVAAAREALGIYLTTQTSGQTITITGNFTLGITLSGNTALTFPTSGTLTTTTSTLAAFAATTSAQLAGVISDETGSGALVFATTPTLVTPILGVATATSVNKVAITAPATSATLTIANGGTLATSGAFSITLVATAGTSVTLPTTGTLSTLAGSETFTNKILTNPTLTTPNIGVATGTSLAVTGAISTSAGTFNGVDIVDSNSSSLELSDNAYLGVASGSSVTFDGTGGDFTFGLTGASCNVLFPASGTVVTLAGSESCSNKTLVSPIIADGLTATGSASNNFSGSTGTFQTSSGLTTITGGLVGSVQALAGYGALSGINVTTVTTTIATSIGAATTTLTDGTSGQLKSIVMIADGGDCVVTVSNLRGGTTITFADAGDSILLQFLGTRWEVLSNNGTVIA